jgi:signal transduction histidine kinase
MRLMSRRPSEAPQRLTDPAQGEPDRLERMRIFLAARPWIFDSVVWALPVAFLGVSTELATAETSELSSLPVPVHLILALLQTVPLALRRTVPLISSLLIAVGNLLAVLTMIGPNFGVVAVPLTIYSTTAFGTRAQGRIVLGLGFVGAVLLGGWLYLVSLQATIGPDSRPLMAGEYLLLATIVALCAAIVFIAWLLGGVIYRRRREIEGVRERNRLLERERESETRLAADAERMRIAREMHDVIAHSLSVVIAQADGGRYVAKTDPAAAVGVLETISQTGREALAQTRSLLGFLRSDEDDSWSKSPLPGVGDIESLIADVRSAGLPVSVSGIADFDEEQLPEGAALAVYRIVQEALTNVLKHAGSGARAHVSLQLEGRELLVRISDDGAGEAPEKDHNGNERARGHGIIGMKERAALYGGTLTARAIHSTGLTDASEGSGTSGGSVASGGVRAAGAANVSGGEPAFSSGKVPGSAFGTATGFLVEARFPLKRDVESQGAGTEAVGAEAGESQEAGTEAEDTSGEAEDHSVESQETSAEAVEAHDTGARGSDDGGGAGQDAGSAAAEGDAAASGPSAPSGEDGGRR